ncbi:hypothetical protein H112_04201 [Trichophyton rubrum D6]|uniref:Uncharacterized protein n=3 Tax=Trichophyton TaxID=5550 RepID=A0A080WKU4_TRIRC|nr:uncharacterized protein TERG_12087 [Trichophyton rubrum CBS 118892]EZF23047.1 hypothetical protein H100_04206 [Trichophyton rubrum MR850]EZF42088.1 hypothetical protein H102_04195 [Trichophyton rubrum CBS 100081]EZF52743.1 hypothetical protein H103_04203 [Trichophyton rubrum CBS 288.86]EZF63344.1 hypothetical protein H104_04192 [Trichophyton rubrum CBS 289.86]EZF73881.1 hypothetical protein H105_04220 [Trichophyton soudanense CBS 452.61]EZF84656.1 hypothetical protein H110_04196 [Trichophy
MACKAWPCLGHSRSGRPPVLPLSYASVGGGFLSLCFFLCLLRVCLFFELADTHRPWHQRCNKLLPCPTGCDVAMPFSSSQLLLWEKVTKRLGADRGSGQTKKKSITSSSPPDAFSLALLTSRQPFRPYLATYPTPCTRNRWRLQYHGYP